MKQFLLSAAAVALIAGPAAAGGLDDPVVTVQPTAPTIASSYDWSGFYIGAQGGALMGDMEYTPGLSFDIDPELTYGAFAGYNFQDGAMVYGGEIAGSVFDGYPVGFPTETFDYIVDAKLRVGYAMDNVLVYGFGGVSTAQYTDAVSDSWQLYGANFGLGGEVGVTDNVAVGVEYIGRYLTGDTATAGQTQDNWLHGVQARVSFRF